MRKQAVRRLGGQAIGVLGLCGLLTAYPSNCLTAQSDPRLVAAVHLAQSGRGDSARALVRRLLAALPRGDSVYPEALFTAGVIATDSTSVKRVVVEYGQSPWADDALLWLTQLHFAQGDPGATVQTAERLLRDYPDSPLRARVAFPAARAYFDLRDETRGCALVREALAGADDDVEFRNQVDFYAARCAGLPPTPIAQTPDSAPPAAPGAAGGGGARSYAVQVLAVKSASQVDELLTRLKVMGFDARVLRDTSGFLKVRVGHYTTREEAQRVQQRLKTRLGGQPFVVEEP